MKILVIGPIKFDTIDNNIFLSNSGISYCIWGWAQGFAKIGNEVAVLPTLNVEKPPSNSLLDGIKILPGPLKKYKFPFHISGKLYVLEVLYVEFCWKAK